MTKFTADTSKTNKRKGTRSVSTLTPAQLARKRANDREAQRAIRARTKEHIESLERQVDDLQSQQARDRVVQELLRRNRALEDELRRLRESLGLPIGNSGSITTTSSSTMPSHSTYALSHQSNSSIGSINSTISTGSSAGGLYQTAAAYPGNCTRTPHFAQAGPEYQAMHNGPASYGNMDEHWNHETAMPSAPSPVSSPSSGGTDDYGSNNYIPASLPPSGIERTHLSPTVGSAMNSPGQSSMGAKGGFEDIKSEFGYPPVSVVPLTPTFHAQQPWHVYPMYYPGSPATMS